VVGGVFWANIIPAQRRKTAGQKNLLTVIGTSVEINPIAPEKLSG
jgi:hypothetical protein